MKNRIFIILWFSILYTAISAQKDYEKEKAKFFPQKEAKIKLIADNWGMYFKEDVASVLDPETKNYMFELKLDSYGCIYPKPEILNVIEAKEFEDGTYNLADNATHSFYRIFKNDNGEKIRNHLRDSFTGDEKTTYTKLLDLAQENEPDSFYLVWDKYHERKFIADFQKRIKDSSITRIIFFIHGFNVPYSLAVLQAITLYNSSKSELNRDKTLLVPIYWPSNNAKECKLYEKDFDITNKPEYSGNGRLFFYYSNRCYYAAITLRKILSTIDEKIRVDVIAHSLGATIATSALINTVSKLDYYRISILRKHADNPAWICRKAYRKLIRDKLGFDIIRNFYANPIPERSINVFLSAAAIPGRNTFCDIDPQCMQKKVFYVTINPNDEMVTKTNIRKAVKELLHVDLAYINPGRLSATSLGCNYQCEAYLTKCDYEKKMGYSNCFKVELASEATDHDIFTYIQQPEYRKFLKEFLQGK